MIYETINEFRQSKNVYTKFNTYFKENKHCLWHCHYMANIGELKHTGEEYLKGKSEAIAKCSFKENMIATLRYLIFNVLGDSRPHTEILLRNDNLAFAVHTHNCSMYITIRGW